AFTVYYAILPTLEEADTIWNN
ncbi:hypothetical protein Tco_0670647, partial [Tanacetum coccineum]